MATPRCWLCKAPLDIPAGTPVGRSESCPECDADVRSCRGCAFYDAAQETCHEPTAEPPADRERANFCSAYTLALTPSSRVEAVQAAPISAAEEARRRLEALFGKR